jgi:zinc transport system substrate-binding protein
VTDRLSAVDRRYREALGNRTHEHVLFAGHDSFGYLARRYGFELESLNGLAPDASPSPRALARAGSFVAEHGIEHVLAPVFESDRAAQVLVEETPARSVLPLTPVPTLSPDWRESDWGFLDVVEQVNLPSLVRALGADA